MTRYALPAAVLLSLVLSGCGGSDEDAKPSSTFSTSASTETAAPSPSESESEGGASVEIDLEEALLSIDDLPAGWAKEAPDEDDEDKTFCDYEVAHEPVAEAGAQFSTNSELLGVSIRQYDSEESAAEILDQLRDVLDDCTGEEIDGDDVSYSRLSADPVGDDTVGVRLAGESEGFEFTLDEVFVLRGSAVLQVGLVGVLFAPSGDELNEFAEQQVRKYDATVKGSE